MSIDQAPVTTQSVHPWRATLRTAVQVGIPAFVGLCLLLPFVINEVATGPIAGYVPPGFLAWLIALAGFITAAAATIARIAAIPGVVEWTRKYLRFLAPDDQPAASHAAAPVENTTADAAALEARQALDRIDGPDHRA